MNEIKLNTRAKDNNVLHENPAVEFDLRKKQSQIDKLLT